MFAFMQMRTISFRVTPEEHLEILQRQVALKVSTSDYLRLIFFPINRHDQILGSGGQVNPGSKQPKAQPNAEYEKLSAEYKKLHKAKEELESQNDELKDRYARVNDFNDRLKKENEGLRLNKEQIRENIRLMEKIIIALGRVENKDIIINQKPAFNEDPKSELLRITKRIYSLLRV